MRGILRVGLVLLALQLSWGVRTQAPAEPDPCANPTTTPAVGACIHRQLEQADAELGAVYRQTLAALGDEPSREGLRKAQRAWVAYREASAGFVETWYRGGTGVGAYRDQHLLRLTRERTADLREILEEAR